LVGDKQVFRLRFQWYLTAPIIHFAASFHSE
jgi:hypothetical protein